jgi:SPP1 family predicted phage head-tail adaptor
VNAGKLRHRFRLEEGTRAPGAGGGGVTTWTEVVTVWANVVPLTGVERIAAMQAAAALTHRVEIRYRPGITAKHRGVYAGRVFEIRAVIDVDEAHDEMHLLCEEKA